MASRGAKVGGASAAVLLVAGSLIARWEGVRYTPYRDAVGVVTVCYGHTGQDIVADKAYTPAECRSLLDADMRVANASVHRCLPMPLLRQVEVALTSATFNLGPQVVCGSTLQRKAFANDWPGACAELSRWNKAGGREMRGLTLRRGNERAVCEGARLDRLPRHLSDRLRPRRAGARRLRRHHDRRTVAAQMAGLTLHFLAAHWPLAAAAVIALAVCVWMPAVGMAVARWLLGTERGRYLLLAGIVVAAGMWGWEARFSAGYAAAVADQARTAASAHGVAVEQAVARDDTAAGIGAKTGAETGQRIDQGNKASKAAQERIGERIAANPAVDGCAGPDPLIVRDVEAADARVQAAADRMQRMGASAAGVPPAGGVDGLAPVGRR